MASQPGRRPASLHSGMDPPADASPHLKVQHADHRLTAHEMVLRKRAATMLCLGAIFGLLGFAFAAITGFIRLRAQNDDSKFQVPYFTATVSEMVHDPRTPQGKVFWAFEYAAAILIFFSWYPTMLRNAYIGDDAAVCCISWVTWRQYVPTLGMMILSTVNTVPGNSLTVTDQFSVWIHTTGAGMLFVGYFVVEARALRWGPFRCSAQKGQLNETSRGICARSACISLLALCIVICFGAQLALGVAFSENQLDKWKGQKLLRTAEPVVRRVKIVVYISEVMCGLLGLASHLVIWWFCEERKYDLPEQLYRAEEVASGGGGEDESDTAPLDGRHASTHESNTGKPRTLSEHHERFSADLDLMEMVHRKRAATMMLIGVIFGFLGFGFATAVGLVYNSGKYSNERIGFRSGQAYFPASVGELMHNYYEPQGKVFWGFSMISALLVFFSWYPTMLRNAYIVNDPGVCRIPWVTLRQHTYALGCMIMATVTMVPGSHLSASDMICNGVHHAGVAILFGGYFVCEAHTVSWGPFKRICVHSGLYDQGKDRVLRRACVSALFVCCIAWIVLEIVLAVAFKAEEMDVWLSVNGKDILIDTADAKVKGVKIALFSCEIMCGFLVLFSHVLIWIYCEERHYDLAEQLRHIPQASPTATTLSRTSRGSASTSLQGLDKDVQPGLLWHIERSASRVAALEVVQRKTAANMMINGVICGFLGFAVAFLIGAIHVATSPAEDANGKPFERGLPYFPSTVSEMIHEYKTPEGKVFWAFEFVSAWFIFFSWYPTMLRNAYIGDDATFLGIAWITWRQYMPALGMVILVSVGLVPGPHPTITDQFQICVHLTGAGMMFAGYCVCEAHALGVGPFRCCCKHGKLSETSKMICLRKCVLYMLAFCLLVFFSIGPVLMLAFTPKDLDSWGPLDGHEHEQVLNSGAWNVKAVKLVSYMTEVFSGLLVLTSMGLIWWGCEERHFDMPEQLFELSSKTAEVGEKPPVESMSEVLPEATVITLSPRSVADPPGAKEDAYHTPPLVANLRPAAVVPAGPDWEAPRLREESEASYMYRATSFDPPSRAADEGCCGASQVAAGRPKGAPAPVEDGSFCVTC
mmetsp:Transcript_77290/g.236567  ORF Transcript_77290/g.236567 Transcript_77290/m.236567 type:complete len:1095 (-) Transcript_77290:37-3321(-)